MSESESQLLAIISEIVSMIATFETLTPAQAGATRKILSDIAKFQSGSQTSLPFGKGSVNI